MTSVPSNSRAQSARPRIPVSKLTLKASLDLRNVGCYAGFRIVVEDSLKHKLWHA